METSYNGWPASPDPERINATWFEVPTVPKRQFRCVEVAHPLFKYLIRRFHAEVDPLPGGVMDEWSYAYRKARAANALSCHASGTAVDLDATQFPMGRANMSKVQRAAVTQIIAASRKQFRWGGWFRMPYTDEMHFELIKGTNPTTVKAAIATMALHPDGRQIHPGDLGKSHKVRVPLLKAALAQVQLYSKRPRYNGKWNDQLEVAWRTWASRRPKASAQSRIDELGRRSGLF